MAALLRARGHTVCAPTQTGCGERSHLMSKSITLDTFVDDIANVFIWEDLHDVVLVGHSFGGIAVTGVADRMPERISRLIYLDAVILESGETLFGQLPPEVVQARLKAAEPSGGLSIEPPPPGAFGVHDAEQSKWLLARLTSHPLGTYTSALTLSHPVTNGVPAVYVQCTDPVFSSLQSTRDWVKANGMKTVPLHTGHDAMVTAPEALTDLLETLGT